ncbi:hypothetical protein [Lacrimispora sp.]|uniref:hypothetical protein n=1 Tax=Lacrimispora sp. TaxID=2719234 RepID=UPI003460BAB2
MRYIEWLLLFAFGAVGIALSNFIGYGASFMESLPGLLILMGISMTAVVCTRVIPIRMPIIAYCSLIGLALASPISPVRQAVISYVGAINFTAPFTIVGAFAGMSISNQLKTFLKQGWKILIVGLLVMTGAFVGSVVWSTMLLKISSLF